MHPKWKYYIALCIIVVLVIPMYAIWLMAQPPSPAYFDKGTFLWVVWLQAKIMFWCLEFSLFMCIPMLGAATGDSIVREGVRQ